jgi:hypothetical protein
MGGVLLSAARVTHPSAPGPRWLPGRQHGHLLHALATLCAARVARCCCCQGGASTSVASIGRIGTRGVVPRDMALRIAAPKTCSYTWTDTKSFCHVIYTGNLTATTALDIDTTLGGFLEASLWQDAFPWMAYSEVTCTLDLAGKGGAYEKDCTNPLRYRSMTDLSLQAKVAQLSSQPTQTGPTAAGQGRGPGQGRP